MYIFAFPLFLVDVPYRRPNRLTYEVETWHVAITHGCAGFRPYEAGLRGLRGRKLIVLFGAPGPSVLREAPSEASHPPQPPRPQANR